MRQVQQQQQHRFCRQVHPRCQRLAAVVSKSVLQTHHKEALRAYQQAAPPKQPVCLARVSEVMPGCRGLVAAQQLQAGQPVLALPPSNTLSVPLGGGVHEWESDWLEPFERAHGSLPPVLVDRLMQTVDHGGYVMAKTIFLSFMSQLGKLCLSSNHHCMV